MSQEERAAEIKAREDRKKAAGGGGGGRKRTKKPDNKGGAKLSKFKKAAATWNKAEFKIAKAAVKDFKARKDDGSDDEENVPMKEGDGDAHSIRQKSGKSSKKRD